jgi:hypothetical protein
MPFHVLHRCGWVGNGDRPQKGSSMIQSNENQQIGYEFCRLRRIGVVCCCLLNIMRPPPYR